MKKKDFAPIHPGEILLEDFLKPMDITAGGLAQLIGVDRRRTTDIVKGKRDISADTALRLGRLFGVSPTFWLNLQRRYDLECAHDAAWDVIASTVQPLTLDSAARTI